MVTSSDLLHGMPGSESELRVFARYWEWERLVRDNLPRVLDESLLMTVYQTVFRLGTDRALPCGYEALARFPIAPRVPVALWFRIARAEGLGRELESLAAETAADTCGQLPSDRFLTVNSSLISADVVLGELVPRVEMPVVLDIHYGAVFDGSYQDIIEIIREAGVAISLDDVPLEQLHELRPEIEAAAPNHLKVDVLIGLFDNPMGRFNLAEAAVWCRDAGIALVVERVETPEDFEMLYELGVEMAQGYTLARPA